MIEEPPLLTIKRPGQRPTAEQVAAFKDIPSSVVCDALGGRGALSPEIGHLMGGPVVGPALTVGCPAGDILALLGALKVLAPGDIVMLSFEAFQGCASFGDRVSGMIRNAGAIAIVSDGPVRDTPGIAPLGLSIWCSGVNPASPYTTGPGTVGMPVNIGGMTVATGDMVIADNDGVAIVPQGLIDATAERAKQILSLESTLEADIDNGLVVPPNIEELLNSDKVTWID